MTYHPSGQVATLTAKNATTGDQVTKYVYGTAKAWQTPVIYRNDLLAAEIYPDSDNFEDSFGVLQNGTSGVVDRVEFMYNRVGECRGATNYFPIIIQTQRCEKLVVFLL